MPARYLSTTKATGWEGHPDRTTRTTRIPERILRFVPKVNPSDDAKLQFVRRWLIEFPAFTRTGDSRIGRLDLGSAGSARESHTTYEPIMAGHRIAQSLRV